MRIKTFESKEITEKIRFSQNQLSSVIKVVLNTQKELSIAIFLKEGRFYKTILVI